MSNILPYEKQVRTTILAAQVRPEWLCYIENYGF